MKQLLAMADAMAQRLAALGDGNFHDVDDLLMRYEKHRGKFFLPAGPFAGNYVRRHPGATPVEMNADERQLWIIGGKKLA